MMDVEESRQHHHHLILDPFLSCNERDAATKTAAAQPNSLLKNFPGASCCSLSFRAASAKSIES